MLSVLYADSPPDVRSRCDGTERVAEQKLHPIRALRQHLIRVPRRGNHDAHDSRDVGGRHPVLKEVAHRVDEHHPRARPPQRVEQLLGHQSKVKTLLVWMTGHPSETFGERLSVAVFAPGADLRTAA